MVLLWLTNGNLCVARYEEIPIVYTEHQQKESRDRMLCTPAVCSGGPELKSRSGCELPHFTFMGYSLSIQANAGTLIYMTSPPLSHILSDSLCTNNSSTFVSYVTISCISISVTAQLWARLPKNRDSVPGWSKFSPQPRPDGTTQPHTQLVPAAGCTPLSISEVFIRQLNPTSAQIKQVWSYVVIPRSFMVVLKSRNLPSCFIGLNRIIC